MREQLRQIWSQKTLWYLVFAMTFAFVIPIAFSNTTITDITRIKFVLFGFDTIFSVVLGLFAGKKNHSILFLFFFPIIFWLSYGVFFSEYVRYFSGAYLLLSLLSYGVTKD